jgi:AcrR family transcriptional regulator
MIMQKSLNHSYHHGDLRRALIEAALAFVGEGHANFTLRSVARRAGVSHAAPYNHFKDKKELLSEVTAVGFNLLRKALETPDLDFSNPKALFLSRWGIFLDFAVSNPELYRLMIGPVKNSTQYPPLQQASKAFYDLLIQDLERFARQGFFHLEHVDGYAIIISSQLHGLAMLAIDGRLGEHGRNLDLLAENSIDVILRGMKAIA